MSAATVADLIELLTQSGILDAAQQGELPGLRAAFPDPRALAGDLVKRGWLTPFQVNRLFQGKAGELVLGPYVLLERLGEGGLGQVFKARHRVMNRLVAIKLIRQEHLNSSEAVQRFRREIQVAARLAHPNVVLAHDASSAGDRHYLAMELIEGVDLARLVQRSGPLPGKQACEYVRQAALGLQYAHEQQMVHRDVKPSNLMVDGRGTVKVLDVGLARLGPCGPQGPGLMAVTQAGAVMGTPDYLAPEQALDAHSADTRADIYSLGCTLFFLLTGRPPFPEGTLAQKLLHHQQAEPPSIETLRANVPPAVAAVLRRMMAKRPQDRFQTPAEVAAALAPFCQAGVPVVPSNSEPAPASGERGWTLEVSTITPLPAEKPASLVRGPARIPEAGWSLPVDVVVQPPGPATPPRPARKRHWIGLTASGALALLLLLLVLFLGRSAGPDSGSGSGDGTPPAPGTGQAAALPPIPEGPLTLDVVDDSGAKQRVIVQSTSGSGDLAIRVLAKENRLDEGPLLELNQGWRVSLHLPFNLVRKMAVRGGRLNVTLADGTEHAGTLVTSITGTDEQGRSVFLHGIREATTIRARHLQRGRASAPTWTLTVLDPVNRTFSVLAPRFISSTGDCRTTFSISLDSQKVGFVADLSKLEKLTVNRLDDWMATVKVPSEEPRTGALQGIGTTIRCLACDLPDGSLLLQELPFSGPSPGFVLRKAGPQP